MLKYFILAILTMIFITASDPYFGIDLPTSFVSNKDVKELHESDEVPYAKVRPYLDDYAHRVDRRFSPGAFFFPTVQFWFLMYTQYESSQVIIHDRNNLSLIYLEMDFTPLRAAGGTRESYYGVQQKKANLRKNQIALLLKDLSQNLPITEEHKIILAVIKRAGLEIPSELSARKKFFVELAENLRTQTGQKDFIREGLQRSVPYQRFITQYFTDKGLPKDLMAIPFLESSFNPKAHSRVSALGVWQFMPLIGSFYVPRRTPQVDYRSNVGVSSVAAGFLMQENYRIMRSWDLAVTAYNSGTKHLLKSKRKMENPDATLVDIIRHSRSASFGFASKNFYSEFLALVHTLAYRNELFPGYQHGTRADGHLDLRFYLAKCSLKLDKVLSSEQYDEIRFYNDQIKIDEKPWPASSIFTSKSQLPSRYFKEVSRSELLRLKPKDWKKILRNQSCSTI